MSRVLVNHLNVRAGPSTNSQKVAYYDAGQTINSADLLIENEGRIWLRYTGGSGNKRVQEIKDISALMKVTLYLLMFQGIFLDQDQGVDILLLLHQVKQVFQVFQSNVNFQIIEYKIGVVVFYVHV